MQGRIGKDDVERRIRLPFADVAVHERQTRHVETPSPLEHRVGGIDADRRRGLELAVQRRGEQSGAAPEIDDATGRPSCDQCRKVVERLLALAAKALVLGRIPGVAIGHDTPVGIVSRVHIGGQDSVAPVLSRVWTRLALAAAVCAATGCSSSPATSTTCPTN